MSEERKHDPASDPRLAEALRMAFPPPTLEAEDLEALSRRIAERAELTLARLRGRAPWWAYTAGWARAAVPAALAASVMLALLFGALERRYLARPAPPQRLQLEAALGAAPAEDEVTATVFAAVDRDDLLPAVVEGP
jgi:hypothetical protein